MEPVKTTERERRYIPSLEGIRGYAFLLVFCFHYFPANQIAHEGSIRLRLVTAFLSLALFTVPMFFVLSGFLIGGILYDSRQREGYFKVFYCRRILRVFPVYYLTLMGIAGFEAFHGFHLSYRFWTHFLYIQNLLPGYAAQESPVPMKHLWSLAVEEQFYFLWPLVVWVFPQRRRLIVIASSIVIFCCTARLLAPLAVPSVHSVQYSSAMRADAILCGVLLALLRGQALFDRLKRAGKWLALAGVVPLVYLTVKNGEHWIGTVRGEEVWIPLANLAAIGIVLAVMDEGSWLNRACSQRWICKLGGLSYGLYVFHFVFLDWAKQTLTPYFAVHMRHAFAVAVAGVIAFCVTLLLSILSYILIERPAMKVKNYIRYGAVKGMEAAKRAPVAELAHAGD